MNEDRKNALNVIKNRLMEANDFPALSRAVTMVSHKATKLDETSIRELADVILDDLSITNKILKKVNSIGYASAQGGGRITTITRAVFVAGFEKVKSIALSILLFETLKDKATADYLKADIVTSIMSGAMARDIAAAIGIRKCEEIFIYAVFHDLGKLLVTFLLPLKLREIMKLVKKGAMIEERAVKQTLGVSYQEIGMDIAAQWSFSKEMISTMNNIDGSVVSQPKTESDKIHKIICFANEMSKAMTQDIKQIRGSFSKIMERYASAIPLTHERIVQIIGDSAKEMVEYSHNYESKANMGNTLKHITKAVELLNRKDPDVPEEDDEDLEAQELDTFDFGEQLNKPKRPLYSTIARDMPHNAGDILTKGIQDVSQFMLGGASFNEVLDAILNLMYRSIGFSRVLFCVKHTHDPFMEGRFGLGDNITEIIKLFRFELCESPDFFNLSISRNKEMIVDDINDERIKSRVPDWYRKLLDSQTFMLLPISVNDKPIGIIYADKPSAGDIKISSTIFNSLKVLRDHLKMAIKKSVRLRD
ncbi:MAG: HDOD domain-containing protein [Nitrospirae bacterium]|nr:HDOD domain-containing protein [Nitrospirota bacterium]